MFAGPEISLECYDVLWQTVMRDRPKPIVLHCDSPGRTDEERAWIVRHATPELRRTGYLGPRGAPPDVCTVLATLERPVLAIDIRGFEAPQQWGARIAIDKSRGAAAILRATRFRAWSIRDTALVNEVEALLAVAEPPRQFDGVSVTPDQIAGPRRRGRADEVLRHLAGPYLRRAHITVVATDPFGRTRSAPGLTVNDTAAGRYLVFPDRNEIVIAPGRRGTLIRKLNQLIEHLHHS